MNRLARAAAVASEGTGEGTVDLYWIPLGAGGHLVRFNGIVLEAISSMIQRRPRRDIYHTALAIRTPSGPYTVEMTPVPNRRSWERGIVAQGSVGTRWAGRGTIVLTRSGCQGRRRGVCLISQVA